MKYVQNIVVRKPLEKYPYRKSRRRWENNNKMNLKFVDFDDRKCIKVVLYRPQW
jgi:hypothetical protein